MLLICKFKFENNIIILIELFFKRPPNAINIWGPFLLTERYSLTRFSCFETVLLNCQRDNKPKGLGKRLIGARKKVPL